LLTLKGIYIDKVLSTTQSTTIIEQCKNKPAGFDSKNNRGTSKCIYLENPKCVICTLFTGKQVAGFGVQIPVLNNMEN